MADQLDVLKERLAGLRPQEAQDCPAQRMLNHLDKETAAVVEAAIMNPAIPYTTLTYELRASGLSTSKESIQFHRNSVCTCSLAEVTE